MANLKTKIILLIVALIVAVIWLLIPDRKTESQKKFIRSLDFKLLGIVKKVMPLTAEDHGYGAIYLENFTSNKGDEFDCSYEEKYLFCKINKKQAIIITPGVAEINVGDSVIYDTNTLTYTVYKNRKLYVKNGIAMNAADSFYNLLKISGYLDFSYYVKN